MSERSHRPVRAGDPAEVAIPRLLETQGGRIYALGVRLCGQGADAEDLVQETFLRAYRKWDQFEGRSDPATWLYTIAFRVCHRMHRRRAGEPAHLALLEELLPCGDADVADEASDAAGLAAELREEARARVEAAIAQLPLHPRMAIVLKDIAGLTIEETGAVLGISEGTVKSRVHRARLAVRRELARALPRRAEAWPAAGFPREICLDLLRAKQDALDHGVAFDLDVFCDRCRAVFAELDLGCDLCRRLAEGDLPEGLRRRIEAALRSGAG